MARSIFVRGGDRYSASSPLILSALVWLGVLGSAPGAALAGTATVPAYDGIMDFPAIQGISDPEEYSWEVELGENQELELIDEQTAGVFYKDHTLAFLIFAAEAHDAAGATVPTSLSVPGGSIVALIVHHRAGNSAAGGRPFVYPIHWGAAWGASYLPPIITGARSEQELREERERKEKEEREAARRRWASHHCVVPLLKDRSLPAARKRLSRAGCRVGEVARLKGTPTRRGKVVAQTPKPGTIRASGAAVGLTLGK